VNVVHILDSGKEEYNNNRRVEDVLHAEAEGSRCSQDHPSNLITEEQWLYYRDLIIRLVAKYPEIQTEGNRSAAQPIRSFNTTPIAACLAVGVEKEGAKESSSGIVHKGKVFVQTEVTTLAPLHRRQLVQEALIN
jgi:hypothetical protein